MRNILIGLLVIQFYSCSRSQNTIENNPQAVQLNIKALDYLIRSDYDTALLIFDQAIAIDPSFDLPYRNKYRIYFVQKDFKNALITSEALIKIYPEKAEWWLNGGMILDKLGNSGQAKEYYLKALEIIENDINKQTEKENLGVNMLAKGLTLILLGEEQKGRSEIDLIIAANPDNMHIKGFATITKEEYLENVLDKQIYFNEYNNEN